jgi:broad specificity phosphatase PhoE
MSLLEEEDPLWTAERESKMELARRCEEFLGVLAARPESHIAVVSHSGFLLTLFSLLLDCPPDLKQWFNTGEMRSVCLELAV